MLEENRLRTEATGKLIVALDVPAAQAALRLAGQLRGHAGVFKVGLELFSAEGPALVSELVALGARVFLDLKLHDIPNTVRGAAREAARRGVAMLTVHASGGRKMMQAALEGVREGAGTGQRPRVLGVTVLTSLADADLAEVGWNGPAETATRLAMLAHQSALDGVIASTLETACIRQACGAGFAIVTPGIRPAAAARDDQARAATPRAAICAGADFLVVGRPITQAPEPAAAADAILEEIIEALASRLPEAAAHGRS
jgi:orotidine-5'-phosphate decarboxylase